MDEAGGILVAIIAIGVAIYAVVVFVGYIIAYTAFVLFFVFGHSVSFALALTLAGAIGGGLYHSQRDRSDSVSNIAVVRIGPFESSARGWFFISSTALIGALVAYRVVAF